MTGTVALAEVAAFRMLTDELATLLAIGNEQLSAEICMERAADLSRGVLAVLEPTFEYRRGRRRLVLRAAFEPDPAAVDLLETRQIIEGSPDGSAAG